LLKLYVGNKNYSSWSMRTWVLLTQMRIPFEEVTVRFDSFDAGSQFKRTLSTLTPTGRVPVLVDSGVDGGLTIWDTLAIAEYLAEKFSHLQLWPQDAAARARARSVCAEMHAGFTALRSHCPMNIEASLPEVGQLIWRDQPAVRANVARLVAMWSELLAQHGGPQLFGNFTIADAYFAPICMRLKTYALPLPPVIAAYVDRVAMLPGVAAWIEKARAERDFLDFEEPYRLHR